MSESKAKDAPTLIVKIFDSYDFSTRVGIAAVIILFLLFSYYLIGGYTNTCGCGSGEPYQNCAHHRRPPAYAHSHPYGGHPHAHMEPMYNSAPPPSIGSSNIYQAGPYLNF